MTNAFKVNSTHDGRVAVSDRTAIYKESGGCHFMRMTSPECTLSVTGSLSGEIAGQMDSLHRRSVI